MAVMRDLVCFVHSFFLRHWNCNGSIVAFSLLITHDLARFAVKSLKSASSRDDQASKDFLAECKAIAHLLRNKQTSYNVYYITDASSCDDILSSLTYTIRLCGLDCEWISRAKKDSESNCCPVALLQLSTENGDCFLVQLSAMGGIVPASLKAILEDRTILKFGVGILGDCERLRRLAVFPRGCVDLRHILHRCVPIQRQQHFRQFGEGLASLSTFIVGLEVEKSGIQRSNWEQRLTEDQIMYAALDAVASLEVFLCLALHKLFHRKQLILEDRVHLLSKDQTENGTQVTLPVDVGVDCYKFNVDRKEIDAVASETCTVARKSDSHFELWTKTFENQLISLCQGLVDLPYRKSKLLNTAASKLKQRSSKIDTKMRQKIPPTRRRPLYENCLLLSPDGKVLCTCDSKKIAWYLDKKIGSISSVASSSVASLFVHCSSPSDSPIEPGAPWRHTVSATLECEDPLTARLLFSPSGFPTEDRLYYTTVKENICVVCGGSDKYSRKMVVPHEYKRHFPAKFKDRLSHDVQLLCPTCHQVSCRYDEQLRQQLALKYDAPIGTYGTLKTIEDNQLRSVKSASKALLVASTKLPTERRNVLEKIVKDFTTTATIDVTILKQLSTMNTRKPNYSFVGTHGEKVVQGVLAASSIPEFITMWREHFVATMQPKFMPKLWSIDHSLGDYEQQLDSLPSPSSLNLPMNTRSLCEK